MVSFLLCVLLVASPVYHHMKERSLRSPAAVKVVIAKTPEKGMQTGISGSQLSVNK